MFGCFLLAVTAQIIGTDAINGGYRLFIKSFLQGLALGILVTAGLFAFWSYTRGNIERPFTFQENDYSNYPYDTNNSIVYKPNFPDIQDFQAKTQRKVQVYKGYDPCSCVSFAKSVTGFSQSVGPAKNWPRNDTEPRIGSVVITSESRFGHVAYISEVTDLYLILEEANYIPCKKTTGRKLPIDSPLILGYYNPQ